MSPVSWILLPSGTLTSIGRVGLVVVVDVSTLVVPGAAVEVLTKVWLVDVGGLVVVVGATVAVVVVAPVVVVASIDVVDVSAVTSSSPPHDTTTSVAPTTAVEMMLRRLMTVSFPARNVRAPDGTNARRLGSPNITVETRQLEVGRTATATIDDFPCIACWDPGSMTEVSSCHGSSWRDREVTMMDGDANLRGDRVPLAEALSALRRADESTDAGFTEGLRDALVRFVEAFDELWVSDATFRERWRPRPTRLRQIFSGRYLDQRLHEVADATGVEIALQLSEHGGHWDFVGTTRYKPAKGGRSLKLWGAFEPRSAARCRACIGSHDDRHRKGRGTYGIAELIISPDGELLMIERDVTGGARHLWAYYVDGFRNRGVAEEQRVTSPDIMDARMYRDESTGAWEHRTGSVRVHRTRLRTGCTESWIAGAPWLDGDPETGIVVVPPARHRGPG